MFLTLDEHEIDNICKNLQRNFQHYKKKIEYLQARIEELEDEHWKDNKLQEMKNQLEEAKKNYHRGFPINEEEYEKALNWMDDHEATKHARCKGLPRGGAIGGSYQWIFTPTSIGVFGEVKCSCGESFSFSDDF